MCMSVLWTIQPTPDSYPFKTSPGLSLWQPNPQCDRILFLTQLLRNTARASSCAMLQNSFTIFWVTRLSSSLEQDLVRFCVVCRMVSSTTKKLQAGGRKVPLLVNPPYSGHNTKTSILETSLKEPNARRIEDRSTSPYSNQDILTWSTPFRIREVPLYHHVPNHKSYPTMP